MLPLHVQQWGSRFRPIFDIQIIRFAARKPTFNSWSYSSTDHT